MEPTAEAIDFGAVVSQITENVFQTMMGMEVRLVDTPFPPAGELITAVVSLAGGGGLLLAAGYFALRYPRRPPVAA